MYVKDSFESKYQLRTNKKKTQKKLGLNKQKIQRHLLIINKQCEFHEILEDCNSTKKGKVLIVLHDMITDMKANEKLSPIVTELLLGEIFNISLVFISQ